MKRIFAFAILTCLMLQSCRKENSATSTPENRAQASIEIDGEQLAVTYNSDQTNNCETYSFVGSAGYYYGVSSRFDISGNECLQIIFGTLLTDSSSLTEEGFLKLIEKGNKTFGSLGAFGSFPGLESNKVEIAFTDKKSVKWCSTEITEKNTQHGIETNVNIHQPSSEFVVEDVEKAGAQAFGIKGKFKCFIYQVNGKKKKRMNGKFTAIIRMGQ